MAYWYVSDNPVDKHVDEAKHKIREDKATRVGVMRAGNGRDGQLHIRGKINILKYEKYLNRIDSDKSALATGPPNVPLYLITGVAGMGASPSSTATTQFTKLEYLVEFSDVAEFASS